MKIGHHACVLGAVFASVAAFGCSSSSTPGSTDSGVSGTGGTTGSTGGTSAATGGATTSTGGAAASTGGAATSTGGATGGGTPSITITSPTANATISMATDSMFPDLPVSFTLKNFTLETKAQQGFAVCAKGSCGHVHMYAHEPSKDKGECNDVPDGLGSLYNAAAFGAKAGDTSATQNMGLDYCPTIPGTRVLLLELHNDDHSPVTDSSGATISATVTINVVAGDGGTTTDGGGTDAGDGGH